MVVVTESLKRVRSPWFGISSEVSKVVSLTEINVLTPLKVWIYVRVFVSLNSRFLNSLPII